MFTPGMRVVIRYSDGDTLTDALGEVLTISDNHIRVLTKRGPVDVPTNAIETAHQIPPAPTRPGKLHEIVSATDLRKIAAAVWSPPEIAWLHADNLRAELAGLTPEVSSGWLLRSAPGTTPAANSVLPVSDPGLPADEALPLALDWLTERNSSPHVIIHTDGEKDLNPTSQAVAPLLRPAGFTPSQPILAMTAPTAQLAQSGDTPSGLTIVESDQPAPAHLGVWGVAPENHRTYAPLVTSSGARILSAVATHPDGSRSLVGVVRVASAQKWAVVSHLVVNPGVRRRGAGRALVAAACRISLRRGLRSVLFDAPLGACSAFATALGFGEHHRLWLATPATTTPAPDSQATNTPPGSPDGTR